MAEPWVWNHTWREDTWSQLGGPWDLIVIGGGITGAGVLREAARIGMRALLLEANDFASGTSSRSSKLVHGGFRYLKNAQFRVTLQSLKERERLLREGKGLVERLGFLYAGYQGDRYPLWSVGLGLTVYDLLVLQWRHRHYGAAAFQSLCPPLSNPKLRGGYRYFDALTDDARLVLRLIREAVADGATALNYVRVHGLLRMTGGQIAGIAAQDKAPDGQNRSLEIQAPYVVNATGAWADELRQLLERPPQIRTLRGSHLVVNQDRLPLNRAVTFAHPADGRPVFAVPWENVVLMGTTDHDHPPPIPVDPAISGQEVDYLLAALQHAFPALALGAGDIQAAYAGIRAVKDTGKADPSKESREHLIWEEDGLITVSGGKLTTFRLMAREVLRRHIDRHPRLLADRVRGRDRGQILATTDEVVTRPSYALDTQAGLRLAGRYGPETPALLQAVPGKELTPVPGTRSLWAELRWGARAEAVVHLEDLLLRRVRVGLTLPDGGLEYEDRIRAIVESELGWDTRRWNHERQRYHNLISNQYRV